MYLGVLQAAGYSDGDVYDQIVFNRRTGAVVPIEGEGWLQALADGWALVNEPSYGELRVLATGEALTLTTRDAQLATDGVRTVGWSNDDEASLADTWTLIVPATDGSGTATSVYAERTPSGTVIVA